LVGGGDGCGGYPFLAAWHALADTFGMALLDNAEVVAEAHEVSEYLENAYRVQGIFAR